MQLIEAGTVPKKSQAVASQLQQSLGGSYSLWALSAESGAELVESEGSGWVAPREDLHQVAQTMQTRCYDLGNGEAGAVVPLGKEVVACYRVAECTPKTLALLTDSLCQQIKDRNQLDSLSEENDLFAAQLSSDLEELTLLRSMVDRLGEGAEKDDLMTMAERILPDLNGTIRARSLALMLPNSEKTTTLACVGVQIGSGPLEEAALIEIVERFAEEASQRPFVRNWGEGAVDPAQTVHYEAVAGVDSLVLTPLVAGSVRQGWLVAANRLPTSETVCESPWQLASDEFGSGEGTLLATTASILAIQATNRDMLLEKEQIMVSVVRSLVSAIEAKDEYTRGHSERVALYAQQIALELGYTQEEAERLYLSGLLHDVGKIGVSDAVLKKAGALTDEEFAEIQRHPDEGWSILSDLKQLSYVLPGVLHHHERVDGHGYPDKLTSEVIPLDGRVMAVADAYDAMTSDRAYRRGMPNAKAEAILREGSGSQWDPNCIDAFFRRLEKIQQIQATYQPRLKRQRTAPETGLGAREGV